MLMAGSSILPKFLVVFMVFGIAIPRAETKAFFVFGDSLVDNGNNNFLVTTARADIPPYGIDAPDHRPTGRFSNGKNIADFISEAIGSEPLLPYLSPELTGQKLLVGANFASAGIGILNDTGFQFINILHMHQQFQCFEEYKQKVTAVIGAEATQKLIDDAIYLITVGGNDFVNNYFLVPLSRRSRQFELPDYVKYLISEYEKLLTRLHDLGARKVLVTGTGPIGCVPAELAVRSRNGECAERLQEAASLFNPQLNELINGLNSRYGAIIFIAANTEQMNNDFVRDPQAFGFKTSKVACCGQGPYNGIGLCTRLSNLCPNRDEYAFWDPFHPSEKANRIIVQQILQGSAKYMHPMNLSTMLAMDSRT